MITWWGAFGLVLFGCTVLDSIRALRQWRKKKHDEREFWLKYDSARSGKDD